MFHKPPRKISHTRCIVINDVRDGGKRVLINGVLSFAHHVRCISHAGHVIKQHSTE